MEKVRIDIDYIKTTKIGDYGLNKEADVFRN